jgi:hypothetical protein
MTFNGNIESEGSVDFIREFYFVFQSLGFPVDEGKSASPKFIELEKFLQEKLSKLTPRPDNDNFFVVHKSFLLWDHIRRNQESLDNPIN